MGLLILVLCLALPVFCSSSDEDAEKHRVDLQYHFHHLERISRFSCHEPQHRVVPVLEMVHQQIQHHGHIYHPDSSVLHRCHPSTGCCTEGKVCGPVHVHTVHLAFMVTSLEDPHPLGSNPWHLEYLPAINHTKCGCVHHIKETSVIDRPQGTLLHKHSL